jgi:hypothetical protein
MKKDFTAPPITHLGMKRSACECKVRAEWHQVIKNTEKPCVTRRIAANIAKLPGLLRE